MCIRDRACTGACCHYTRSRLNTSRLSVAPVNTYCRNPKTRVHSTLILKVEEIPYNLIVRNEVNTTKTNVGFKNVNKGMLMIQNNLKCKS